MYINYLIQNKYSNMPMESVEIGTGSIMRMALIIETRICLFYYILIFMCFIYTHT